MITVFRFLFNTIKQLSYIYTSQVSGADPTKKNGAVLKSLMSKKTFKLKVMSDLLAGAYLAKGTIGNVGMPGAPVASFSLVVVPSQHSVSGTVVITQAIQGPDSYIVVPVTGKIFSTGIGKVTQVVGLKGQYVHSVPPPAFGSFLADFEANLAIDNEWNGTGGFSYYGHNIENVPVKAANQPELV